MNDSGVNSALTLVVCGAPLTARAHDVAAALADHGWDVTVAATPASRAWLDTDAITAATGSPALFDQRDAGQARGPRPGAVVVCPITMNSASKAACAIIDNYATGVIGEAMAAGLPLTIVATVSERLWPHPAWAQHLHTLATAGARFVDPVTTSLAAPAPIRSGTGPELVRRFDPAALADIVGPPLACTPPWGSWPTL